MPSWSIRENADVIVVAAPYNKELIASFKTVGGRWHGDTKTWRFKSAEVTKEELDGLCKFHLEGEGEEPQSKPAPAASRTAKLAAVFRPHAGVMPDEVSMSTIDTAVEDILQACMTISHVLDAYAAATAAADGEEPF